MAIRHPALFQAFEAELKQLRSVTTAAVPTSWHHNLTSIAADKLVDFAWSSLRRPLANLISGPIIKRFLNRFLATMVAEVEASDDRVAAAHRVTFDVALLMYGFHTYSEGKTLHDPHTVVFLFVKGVARKVVGKRGFFSIQIRNHLNRHAIPWINSSVGAYIAALRRRALISDDIANTLVRYYWATEVIEARQKKPLGVHPLAAHSIHEILKNNLPQVNAYFDRPYAKRILDGCNWNVYGIWRDYAEMWTLSDYDPADD